LPDHSSLTRIRARYGVEIFRRFFDVIVKQCAQAGLVWGRELYIDATQVQADAAMDFLRTRFAVEARAARNAVEAHLADLFPTEDAQDPRVTSEVPKVNTIRQAKSAPPLLASESTPITPAMPPIPLPVDLPNELRTELADANAARHDWIAQEGRQQREVHGYYQRTADFCISATDADATPMRLKGGGTHLGYQTHYVVDGGKRRIILQALVTPGE
jgi:hypothetical protein